jgi:hypothetical protein
MLTLVILIMLGISLALSKSQPRTAGVLDLIVASLILLFRVIPGTASTFDWVFMFLFYAGGTALYFKERLNLASE